MSSRDKLNVNELNVNELNVNEAIVKRVQSLDRNQLSQLSLKTGIDGRLLQKLGQGEVQLSKRQLDKVSKVLSYFD